MHVTGFIATRGSPEQMNFNVIFAPTQVKNDLLAIYAKRNSRVPII
jgi:hypothetical protein